MSFVRFVTFSSFTVAEAIFASYFAFVAPEPRWVRNRRRGGHKRANRGKRGQTESVRLTNGIAKLLIFGCERRHTLSCHAELHAEW